MKRKTGLGEEGFVLVWALLLIVVLVLLGTFGISTSIFESKMAANDALHKQAFYQADGGTEVGLDMLGQNINCINGFKAASFPATGGDGNIAFVGDLNFWINNNNEDGVSAASDGNRDFFYPADYNVPGQPPKPHTNVRLNGRFIKDPGGSTIGMGGYEGLGTNIAKSGAGGLLYDINAQYVGIRNSTVSICTEYLVDSDFASSPAGDCVY